MMEDSSELTLRNTPRAESEPLNRLITRRLILPHAGIEHAFAEPADPFGHGQPQVSRHPQIVDDRAEQRLA